MPSFKLKPEHIKIMTDLNFRISILIDSKDRWLKTHDGEDYCKYCPENAECPHGMACYGGEPIEPPCCGADMKEFLYTDSIIEDALEERYGEE